ncbi:MAG: hypothetical protein MJY64_01445 [archaeon]|nr:hypothetical protein [archaeon]
MRHIIDEKMNITPAPTYHPEDNHRLANAPMDMRSAVKKMNIIAVLNLHPVIIAAD